MQENEIPASDRTDQDPLCIVHPRRLTTSCFGSESECLPPLRVEHVEGSLLLVCPTRFSAHAAHTFSPWLGIKRASFREGHCNRRAGKNLRGFGEQVAFFIVRIGFDVMTSCETIPAWA
jgi:hypothetical protein